MVPAHHAPVVVADRLVQVVAQVPHAHRVLVVDRLVQAVARVPRVPVAADRLVRVVARVHVQGVAAVAIADVRVAARPVVLSQRRRTMTPNRRKRPLSWKV